MFKKMLQEYLESMNIDSAQTVLDMGCGTGVVSRAIAKRDAFSGTVIGIDISSYLLEEARRLALEEDINDKINFYEGDSSCLDIFEKEIDTVVVHTLLSHVDDPLAVLKEAARVVKPRGLVGIFEGDFASLAFGHETYSNSHHYDEAIINAVVTNPRVTRQIPRLLRQSDLELVSFFPYIVADIGKSDFWLPTILLCRTLIPAAGKMSAQESNLMIESLIKASEEGVFFGAGAFYSFVAKRRGY